jgi:hypothetical protein
VGSNEPFEIIVRHSADILAIRGEYEVVPARQFTGVAAYDFVYTATDTVTHHCRFANLAANYHSHPVSFMAGVPGKTQPNGSSANRLPMLVDEAKRITPMKPVRLANHRISPSDLTAPPISLLLGQLLAALGTPAAQHKAAGTASHTLHKAMLARALAFFGLVGSFWHMLSLYRIDPDQTSWSCVSLLLLVSRCYW